MISPTDALNVSRKFLVDNSPTVLTSIAVAGTITTAVLTGKAVLKADRLQTQELIARPTPREYFELTWKLYIPPIAAGALTIGCIVGANHIGHRRAAAVAAAYTLSEKAWSEYRDKVVQTLGEKKESAVRDALAQDRVDRNPVSSREVIIAGGGDVLFLDSFTGRYFKSDMETVKKAQNDTNYTILNDMYASLSDFYNNLGIPPTSYSDEVGWASNKLLELEFSTALSEDGRPCITITFAVLPVRDYYRLS